MNKLRVFFLSGYYRFRMKYTAFSKFSKKIGKSGLETPKLVFNQRDLYLVRKTVLSVSRHTPWESKCMIQALTAKRLLNSMGYPCTLYMGVMNSPGTGEMLAHAWLRCGDKIITGDNGYESYTVTGKFGDSFEVHLTGIRRIKAFIKAKMESGNVFATAIYKLYKFLRR